MTIAKEGFGLLPDPKDERDFCFEALGAPQITEKEWEQGFELSREIPVKNQFQSKSCVGQAFSYCWANLLADDKYKEISAKSIYSLIRLASGGAHLRDGAKTIKNNGALWEEELSSYDPNGGTDEKWMSSTAWYNEETQKMMKELRCHEYYRVTDWSIDGVAKAIKNSNGVVGGVTATNNGTWRSYEPQIPGEDTPENELWGHAIFMIGYGKDDKGKYIKILNSWGKDTGKDGIQILREEWFENQGRWIFPPWVLINKNNNTMKNESAKIIKDKNSSAVGVWLPAMSEEVLKSYVLNVGKELPTKSDGSIDWEQVIEGELKLNK